MKKWIKNLGGFCLGFSLVGILGFLDGVVLSIAIIIMFDQCLRKRNKKLRFFKIIFKNFNSSNCFLKHISCFKIFRSHWIFSSNSSNWIC